MAYIKDKTSKQGITYNYWVIDKFNIFYTNGKGIVDVLFAGYLSKESKEQGYESFETINQQIPFETLIKGFTNMIGFTEDDIKSALYTLKDEYEWFKDSENS